MFCIFENVLTYLDVLILTETWFKEFNVQDVPSYKAYHTLRTLHHSCFVSIFMKNAIASQPIIEFCSSNRTIKLSTVKLSSGNFNCIVFGIYGPLSGSIENFTSPSNDILNNNLLRNKSLVVIEEFNINLLLDIYDANKFANMMQSYHIIPIITNPICFPVNSKINLYWTTSGLIKLPIIHVMI